MIKIGRVSISARGAYEFGERYDRLDMVTYNGAAYISRMDMNESTPSPSNISWQLVLDINAALDERERKDYLFSNSELNIGLVHGNDGTVTTDDYGRWVQVPVEDFDTVTFRATYLVPDFGYAFYDERGRYISGANTGYKDPTYEPDWTEINKEATEQDPLHVQFYENARYDATIVSPKGARYAKVCWNNNHYLNMDATVTVRKDLTYALKDIFTTINDINEAVEANTSAVAALQEASYNYIISGAENYSQGIISATDGRVYNREVGGNYYGSHCFIDVKPLQRIRFIATDMSSDTDGIAFYDKTGKFISGKVLKYIADWSIPTDFDFNKNYLNESVYIEQKEHIYIGYSITIPENCYKIGLSWNHNLVYDAVQTVEVTRDITNGIFGIINSNDNTPTSEKKWKGKNVFCAGDSQTQRAFDYPYSAHSAKEGWYPDILSKTTGLNIIGATPTIGNDANGYNGGTIGGLKGYIQNNESRMPDWSDIDMMTVLIGINDWQGNIPTETLKAQTKDFIRYIKGKNKDIELVFFTNPEAETYAPLGQVQADPRNNHIDYFTSKLITINNNGLRWGDYNETLVDTLKFYSNINEDGKIGIAGYKNGTFVREIENGENVISLRQAGIITHIRYSFTNNGEGAYFTVNGDRSNSPSPDGNIYDLNYAYNNLPDGNKYQTKSKPNPVYFDSEVSGTGYEHVFPGHLFDNTISNRYIRTDGYIDNRASLFIDGKNQNGDEIYDVNHAIIDTAERMGCATCDTHGKMGLVVGYNLREWAEDGVHFDKLSGKMGALMGNFINTLK